MTNEESIEQHLTDKKIISVSLRDAYSYIPDVFMQAPVAIVVYKGPSFVVDFINEKALVLWGKTFEQVINKPLFEISPELRVSREGALTTVYLTGTPITGTEVRSNYRKNGKLYEGFFNSFLQPLRDSNGTIIGVISIATEVTEEVIARRKVEESEKRFRALAEATAAIVWTTSPDGEFTEAQPLWEKYTGQTWNEYKGHGWANAVHPDDRKRVEDIWMNAVKNKTNYFSSGRLWSAAHNGWRYYETNGVPVKDEHGNITEWVAIVRDVHEKVLAEQKEKNQIKMQAQELEKAVAQRTADLSRQKDFIETIINSTPDLITAYDTECCYLVFNRACENFSGLKSADVLGKHLADVYPGVIGTQFQEDLLRALAGETVQNKRYQSGVTGRYYETVAAPLKNETGNIYAAVVIAHDITEAVKATERIKHQNIELEKMNKELEAFAYISSHDLQEPLRKIQTFAARIIAKEKEHLSETAKEYFNRMADAAARMQMLIQDLLGFTRIVNTERNFEITDLDKIIDVVQTDFKEMMEAKKATIEATGLCQVKIIPFQFRQMMHNLISNALKFSAQGIPPRIVIRSIIARGSELNNDKLDADKKYCHISVSDNGIGFEKQYAEKIFEVFQRLHGKEEYPGTGIGLAIEKKIVENHNGFINAESELGKGATFHIYLPA